MEVPLIIYAAQPGVTNGVRNATRCEGGEERTRSRAERTNGVSNDRSRRVRRDRDTRHSSLRCFARWILRALTHLVGPVPLPFTSPPRFPRSPPGVEEEEGYVRCRVTKGVANRDAGHGIG